MAKPNVLIRSKKSKANDLFSMGRLREADAVFAQICQSAPADVESWAMRALIHRKLGAFDQAEALCRRALSLQPHYAWGHHILGSALQCQGRMDEAMLHYRRAIDLQPDLAEAHYFLANALKDKESYVEAVTSYRQAIKFQPDYVEALSNLGAALTILDETEEAIGVLNRANALRPNTPQILCNMADLLQRSSLLTEALEKYQRALELAPDRVDVVTHAAGLLEKINRIEDARTLVNQHLLRTPDNPELLVVAAKLARRSNNVDEAIALLERAIKQNPSQAVAGEIHLLLGQGYDKKGDSERAFEHLTKGNLIVSQVRERSLGNRGNYLDRVARMRSYLTPDLTASANYDEHNPSMPGPIFLLGFPRSGTTLLEQILDSHPSLQTLGEKDTVAAMARAFEEMAQGRKNALAELSPEEIKQLQAVYFGAVAQHLELQPDSLIVDKMPLDTVNVHLIWRVFPKAKFILAIRHPCDACFSCFMQNFVSNEAMSSFVTLEATAEVYSKVMQIWQEAVRLLPLDYHRIRYEDLVADFENETRALLDFMGVGWDENVAKHTEHGVKRGTVNTPSYFQVTQPIYQHAKYRWKRYAKQFESVLPVLQPFIDYFDYRE